MLDSICNSDGVTNRINDQKPGAHECQRGHQRTRRKARQTAHTMSAGTTRAVASAESNEQTSDCDRQITRIDARRGHGRRKQERGSEWRNCHSAQKREAPSDVAATWRKQAALNAADAQNSTIDEYEER